MTETPTQPTNTAPVALDPQALNLAKSIRQAESGGNFNAAGDYVNGVPTSKGAYQWQDATWKAQAGQVLGDSNAAMSPSNQNAVAYGIIKSWKDQGLNPAQIAAKWNSGHEVGWENMVGTNPDTKISYNVPAYVNKVMGYYQQFKSQTPNNSLIPTAQASDGSTPAPTTQGPSVGGFIENIAGSAANLVGGLANAALHPIDTASNVIGSAAGGIEKLFGANNGDTQKFDNIVSYFGKRYGGSSPSDIVHNIGHTIYTDPVGAALDLSTLLDGVGAAVGAVGKVADISKASELAKASDFISTTNGIIKGGTPEAINALKTPGTLSKLADAVKTVGEYTNPINAVTKVGSMAVGAAGRVAGESLGISTGAGYGAIKGIYNAGVEGGDAQAAARAGLSGGEEGANSVIQTAQDAFQTVKNDQQALYRSQLSDIENASHTLNPETIQPIFDQFNNLLKQWKIAIDPENGALDFSKSVLRGESGSVNDITDIQKELDAIKKSPTPITPAELDDLKQHIDQMYSPNSRGSALTTAMKGTVRKVLNDNVPDYEKMTSAYHKTANDLNEFKSSLTGGRTQESVIRKLTNVIRGNNEYRQMLLAKLEEQSGKDITSGAAGVALQSLIPKGLSKYTEGLAAIINPRLLLGLPFASPRIVGEFLLALGKGNRALTTIANAFIKYGGKTAIKVGVEANKASK